MCMSVVLINMTCVKINENKKKKWKKIKGLLCKVSIIQHKLIYRLIKLRIIFLILRKMNLEINLCLKGLLFCTLHLKKLL